MDGGLVNNHQPSPGSTFGISGSSHETCNLCTPLDSMFRVSDSGHSMRTREAIQPSTPERSKRTQQPAAPRQTSVL